MYKGFGQSRWEPEGDDDIKTQIRRGDLAAVKGLIDKCGILSQWDSCFLLCAALKLNHENIAKLLLSKGVDVNPRTNLKLKQKVTPLTPLHYAIHIHDEEIMETLLQRGASINAKAGWKERTPLFEAVFYKKVDKIKILLKHGADVNISCSNNITPLQCATERGVTFTNMLLEYGADPNKAIHHAVRGGKLDVVKLLLSYGADINSQNLYDATPLHVAIEHRHAQLVEYLMKHGADVNAEDLSSSDRSVLCTAVETGDPIMVNIILNHRPNVESRQNQKAVSIALQNQLALKKVQVFGEIIESLLSYGFTIADEDADNPHLLVLAIKHAYVKTVGELLNRGSNLKVIRNSILKDVLPIYPSTLSNKSKLASVLVKYGADENTRCVMGLRPRKWWIFRNMGFTYFELLLTDRERVKNHPDLLKYAIWHGHVEAVECLLQSDIDVNAEDASGRTALHFCVLRRNNFLCPALPRSRPSAKVDKDFVKLLLSRGANVNAATKLGETPLHLAARNNLHDIVEIFISVGVDVNTANHFGTTALHLAAQHCSVKMSECLLRIGAHVNAKDKDGLTPLYIASKNGHLDIVQLLLEYGADINCQTKSVTPVHVASLDGHYNVVKYLVEYGADINITDVDGATALDYAIRRVDPNRTSSVYTVTRDFILRHMAKLKAANLFLNEVNSKYSILCLGGDILLPAIERESPPGRRSPIIVPSRYTLKCEEELVIMKCDKIDDSNISVYDILVGSDERIAKLSANENLVQIVNSDDFLRRFPYYGSLIQQKVHKGRWLSDLRGECSRVLFAIAPLPHLCLERIIDNLTVFDQRMLANVRQCPT